MLKKQTKKNEGEIKRFSEKKNFNKFITNSSTLKNL